MYKNNYYISKFLFLYQKRGEIMKKTTKITNVILGTLMVGFFALGFSSLSQNRDIEADAATTETSRLWAKIVNKDQWDSAGASTYIHYWGESSSTSWFGVPIKWDETNDLVYFDVPSDTTGVIFVRVNAAKDGVWNQTADLVATGHFDTWYFNLTGYGGGEWKNDLTIGTTKIVSDFAATIDTSTEACSSEAAHAAVNAYNALSTFEQDQFDILNVGGGVTGLQRLNFLKSFYGIGTPLNQNITQSNNDKNILAISIIGVLGVFALLSYFFVTKKKHYN